jgi:hypothetical protein
MVSPWQLALTYPKSEALKMSPIGFSDLMDV